MAKKWELKHTERSYLLMLTREEHEYLARLSKEYNEPISVIIRARIFFKGWRKDLEEMRVTQNNTPIREFDARRRRRKRHELDVPIQRPSSQNGGREQDQAGVPEGRSTPDR